MIGNFHLSLEFITNHINAFIALFLKMLTGYFLLPHAHEGGARSHHHHPPSGPSVRARCEPSPNPLVLSPSAYRASRPYIVRTEVRLPAFSQQIHYFSDLALALNGQSHHPPHPLPLLNPPPSQDGSIPTPAHPNLSNGVLR